jgi:hypothetical protein
MRLIEQKAGKEVTVVRVDITCDLMDEDETGQDDQAEKRSPKFLPIQRQLPSAE